MAHIYMKYEYKVHKISMKSCGIVIVQNAKIKSHVCPLGEIHESNSKRY